MRFLGIDYGEKRVGLAISDEDAKIAFPFKTLKNDKELLDMIENICGEEDIEEIVIGESLDLLGKRNTVMDDIDDFAQKLGRLGLPIRFEKEFLTSVEARGRVGKEEKIARKIKKDKISKVDAKAAALILQRYLDRRNK